MAKKSEIKYGTCQNPECMNFGINDQIPADGNCPMCHKPMKAEEDAADGLDMGSGLDGLDDLSVSGGSAGGKKGGNGKKIGIIAAIVVGILIIAGAVAVLLKGCNKGPQLTSIGLNKSEVTLKVGEKDTLRAIISEQGAEATLVWKVSKGGVIAVENGIVTALQEGEGKVLLKVAENNDLKAVCSYKVDKAEKEITAKETKTTTTTPPTPQSGYGTVSLGYGSYTGDLKNGKPHGHGTITYRQSRKIVSWSDQVAQPGDRFEGDFRDGVINGLGYLKTSDGNVIAIQ